MEEDAEFGPVGERVHVGEDGRSYRDGVGLHKNDVIL